MVLLQDGLIAFFSAVGVTTVVWLTAEVQSLRARLEGTDRPTEEPSGDPQ